MAKEKGLATDALDMKMGTGRLRPVPIFAKS